MKPEQRKVERSLAGTFHPRRSTHGYTDVSAGRRASLPPRDPDFVLLFAHRLVLLDSDSAAGL
jgi:hypothetical protein